MVEIGTAIVRFYRAPNERKLILQFSDSKFGEKVAAEILEDVNAAFSKGRYERSTAEYSPNFFGKGFVMSYRRSPTDQRSTEVGHEVSDMDLLFFFESALIPHGYKLFSTYGSDSGSRKRESTFVFKLS
mmetsp:Transcript_12847/g.16661  ORF Transcript_12847/g.16661 Transcript_12847/m.16661 type:complete len:129 (-) Transcript_12847:90-476(-)